MAAVGNIAGFERAPSSAALRPGVGLGEYPQRHDQEPGWGERGVARVVGFLKQRAAVRPVRHARFVRLVNGHEGALRGPRTVVVSEEYAGAATLASEVLRACGRFDVHEIMDDMAQEHAQLPSGVEVPPS